MGIPSSMCGRVATRIDGCVSRIPLLREKLNEMFRYGEIFRHHRKTFRQWSAATNPTNPSNASNSGIQLQFWSPGEWA